jgi:hypothetical protein
VDHDEYRNCLSGLGRFLRPLIALTAARVIRGFHKEPWCIPLPHAPGADQIIQNDRYLLNLWLPAEV